MHDVYFVFKNDQTPGMIMIALTATFVNGTSAMAPAPAATTGSNERLSRGQSNRVRVI